jgi:hypothetical protein
MSRVVLVGLLALTATACTPSGTAQFTRDVFPTFRYRPLPVETVSVVDSPADIRACRFLGDVSPVVQTVPGFTYALEAMKEQTVALGGTHLYLEKRSPDWRLTRGRAYSCATAPVREHIVIRAKG